MKNLKRALSFALATVMVIGMMVVGAGAAFTDAEKIENDEAVAVMYALGVINGKGDGSYFDPAATLTRAEAAKIITYMLLGEDKAETLGTTGAKFTDVPAGHWAETYIGYCANMGIISGYNNEFNPTGELTGLAFGKMLLVALGYDAAIEGYTGTADWGINVAVDMVQAGIELDDDVALDAPLSRDNAAQMAFNTLTATLVKYATKGTAVTVNGVDIVTGAATAEAQKWVDTTGYDYTDGSASIADETIQFCEKYFEGLYKSTTGADGDDDFGRPGYTWYYDADDVCFVGKTAKFVYTSDLNTTAGKKAIFADLKGYKYAGTEIKTKDTTAGTTATKQDLAITAGDVIVNAIAALTANGKVVEIYVDASTKEITAVNAITYKVAKITAVSTNKDGDVSYTLNNSIGTKIDYADDYVNNDTIVLHGTFAKNDYVLTYVGENSTDLHVYPTTKITGQQTANDGTNLTIAGDVYKLGKGVTGYNGIGSTYTNTTKAANYYLDAYGYVVASSEVEADDVYAVVDAIAAKNTTTGLSTGITVDAKIVTTDGVVSTVAVSKINGIKVADITVSDTTPGITWDGTTADAATVSATATNNSAYAGQIVTYAIDKDGKYELTFTKGGSAYETTAAGGTLTNKGVPAFGGQTATNNTVYVVETTKDAKSVFTSYTGFVNVPTIKADAGYTVTAKYVTENSKVVFVYIDATANATVGESTVNNIFYPTSATVTTVGTGSDVYYTVNGILDGVATTLKSKVVDFKVASGAKMTVKLFYTLDINEEGYVTAAAHTTFDANGRADQAMIDAIADGSFAGYLWNDKTEVYVITEGKVTTGSVESITLDDYWYADLPATGTAAEQNTIKVLYIVDAFAEYTGIEDVDSYVRITATSVVPKVHFSEAIAIKAGELKIVLYAGATKLGEAVNKNAMNQAVYTAGFYVGDYTSGSWTGDYANLGETVLTADKGEFYINGVLAGVTTFVNDVRS